MFAIERYRHMSSSKMHFHDAGERFAVMNTAFQIIQYFKSKETIMSHSEEASGLHKQAASDHEAAAKHHHHAASCHDQNKADDAKASSKSAMECCNTAQKKSTSACECSAK